MQALDLFSGIGGLALGFQRAGIETSAFCEIDPAARAVLAHRWPDVPIFEDVTKLTAMKLWEAGLEQPDIITAGFPCQDVSLAGGRGAGAAGPRSGLWREAARLVAECAPRWVLLENSPALRLRGGDEVLSGLETLGYACQTYVVGAVHAGARHRRQRVFILAHRHGPRLEELLDRESGELPTSLGVAGWPPEPGVGRVAYGVPGRVDRIRCIGNAVVPQIAEVFGRLIVHLSAEEQT